MCPSIAAQGTDDGNSGNCPRPQHLHQFPAPRSPHADHTQWYENASPRRRSRPATTGLFRHRHRHPGPSKNSRTLRRSSDRQALSATRLSRPRTVTNTRISSTSQSQASIAQSTLRLPPRSPPSLRRHTILSVHSNNKAAMEIRGSCRLRRLQLK